MSNEKSVSFLLVYGFIYTMPDDVSFSLKNSVLMKCFALIATFCCVMTMSFAQTNTASIRLALAQNDTQSAYQYLEEYIQYYSQKRQVDSLCEVIVLAGEVTEKKYGIEKSIVKVKTLLTDIQSLQPSKSFLSQSYINAAEYYSHIGKNQMAYDADLLALETEPASDNNLKKQILIQRNLGEFARRLANPNLSAQHLRKAVELSHQLKEPDHEQLYLIYNAEASMMWYAARIDSAEYYFAKAIEEVKKIDTTPINQYYRLALLNNNIAGAYNLQGKTTAAIKALETAINSLEKFLKTKGDEDKKRSALSLLLDALDNLAAIYKDLGDYSKTQQLLEYSYQQKTQHLASSDPAIFISKILLGQLYYATHDYDKALDFLKKGLEALQKEEGDYLFWDADANYSVALVYDQTKKAALAQTYYQKADSLYSIAFDGNYDVYYLEFLRNHAQFEAENMQCEQAIKTSQKAFQYLKNSDNTALSLQFYHFNNLARIYFICKDYKLSLDYATSAVNDIRKYISQSRTAMDSIKREAELPEAILLKTKADYNLMNHKDSTVIQSLLKELDIASQILDRRKAILTYQEDVNILLANNKQLTDFIKQLNYELFKLSDNKKYIDKILSTHEGALYTRIRSRMEQQNALRFAHVPKAIQEQEDSLKHKLKTILTEENAEDDKMASYLQALKDWSNFQQKLKKQYPDYYKMRYAATDVSVKELSSIIPKDITIVRYIFSEENLLALIVTKDKQILLSLVNDSLKEKIIAMNAATKVSSVCLGSYELYNSLWQPLQQHITTRRVIIIPDEILYTISFEMLTPVATHSYDELSKKCLLNQYSFSYHYSLLALGMQRKHREINENFVGFTPGFSEQSKAKYKRYAQTDSLHLDKDYLSLLPLPFTDRLAQKIKQQLGGKLFSANASTPETFKKEAANHHILYIGTHAENNNDYPEYSRLIFAKNSNDFQAENSIYLYDIYDCDLTSDLAILTACESGKPGYQDGEGMISMAHAFNYAGSESIMTGLWKIDEQSSAMITESFYENLENGMSKDVALQKAKLSYLQKARGRMLAPQYWAGLVIMGDLSPMQLEASHRMLYYIAGGVFVIALFIFFWRYRKGQD